jgi:hypothetical protein
MVIVLVVAARAVADADQFGVNIGMFRLSRERAA